jgi:FkbM family methyltransferase
MGLLGRGVYEPVETNLVRERVTAGNIAVDIGANFGWYTTLFSDLVGPTGLVHAFEPVPDTFEVLKTNCRLNACRNVLLNNCALGDRDGTAMIHQFPGEPSGHASLLERPNGSSVASVCTIQTLDDYMVRFNRVCHFIKCDVEGAELAVLRGASALIRTSKPLILLEVNTNTLVLAGHGPVSLLRFILSFGYLLYLIDPDGEALTEIGEPLDDYKFPACANILCLPDRPPTGGTNSLFC